VGLYLLKRLLHAIPIVFGVTLITFLLFHVVSPDPAMVSAGKGADAAKIQEERIRLGTDKPLTEQYLEFLRQAVTLDFGESWKTRRPVMEMVGEGIVPSLSLTVPAFLIELWLAVSLALFCAYHRGSFADVATMVVTVAMMSVPALSYIILGQYYAAHRWGMFPVFGYEPGLAGISTLVLPILIWVALVLGGEVRFFRTVVLEEMRQDYVRTAASKGLGTRRILFGHVLKNALIPILTRVIVTIPFLILGSLLIERFFGIPGLGSLTVDAVATSDFPVIKAMVVISAYLLILFNLVTDVAYGLADPRVRVK
jgi:peptide/nickel transport system permease protein